VPHFYLYFRGLSGRPYLATTESGPQRR